MVHVHVCSGPGACFFCVPRLFHSVLSPPQILYSVHNGFHVDKEEMKKKKVKCIICEESCKARDWVGGMQKARCKCLGLKSEDGRSAPSSRRISQPPQFSWPGLSTPYPIQVKNTKKNAESNYNPQEGLVGHKIKRKMWLECSVPTSSDGNPFLQFPCVITAGA